MPKQQAIMLVSTFSLKDYGFYFNRFLLIQTEHVWLFTLPGPAAYEF